MSRQNAAAGNRPRTSLDILEHIPLIITKPGQNLTYEVTRILELNHAKPNILMDTSNLTTAINLVARQAACAFVPEEGANVCQHPGEIIYFEIDSKVDCVWDLGRPLPQGRLFESDMPLIHLGTERIDILNYFQFYKSASSIELYIHIRSISEAAS